MSLLIFLIMTVEIAVWNTGKLSSCISWYRSPPDRTKYAVEALVVDYWEDNAERETFTLWSRAGSSAKSDDSFRRWMLRLVLEVSSDIGVTKTHFIHRQVWNSVEFMWSAFIIHLGSWGNNGTLEGEVCFPGPHILQIQLLGNTFR